MSKRRKEKGKKSVLFPLLLILSTAFLTILILSLFYWSGGETHSPRVGGIVPTQSFRPLKIEYYMKKESCTYCEVQERILDEIERKFRGFVAITKHDIEEENLELDWVPFIVVSEGKSGRIPIYGPVNKETLEKIICVESLEDLGELCE